jgi:hypothetical protein
MSISRQEFFGNASVIASLDDYAEAALDHLEANDADADLPELPIFLKQRGIEVPEGPIKVHRTVGDPNHVMRPICPDGSDGCVPKCRKVHGELQCVWVCRCP